MVSGNCSSCSFSAPFAGSCSSAGPQRLHTTEARPPRHPLPAWSQGFAYHPPCDCAQGWDLSPEPRTTRLRLRSHTSGHRPRSPPLSTPSHLSAHRTIVHQLLRPNGSGVHAGSWLLHMLSVQSATAPPAPRSNTPKSDRFLYTPPTALAWAASASLGRGPPLPGAARPPPSGLSKHPSRGISRR